MQLPGHAFGKRRNNVRLFLIGAFVLFYVPFLLSQSLGHLRAEPTDLPSFYWASVVAFDGDRSPYGPDAFSEIERSTGQEIFPFLYPPPSLLVFYPFAWMPFFWAKALALCANHVICLALVFFLPLKLVSCGRRRRAFLFTVSMVYFFHFFAVSETIHHGQINLLVLACLCVFWHAMQTDRSPPLASAALAGAILLKTYPAVFLAYLLVKRRYRIVAWTCLFLSAAVAASVLALPGDAWSDWLTKVLPTGGYGKTPAGLFSPAAPWNQSLNGFMSRLFVPNPFSTPFVACPMAGRLATYAGAVLLVAATLWLSANARKHGGGACWDVEFALMLLTMFLIAPISWRHHLVFVLPGVLVGFSLIVNRRINGLAGRSVILLSAGVLAWRLPVAEELLTHGLPTLAISLEFYAVAALWGILVWFEVVRQRDRQAAE